MPAARPSRSRPMPATKIHVQAYIDARACAEFGKLDVVCANAGISGGLVPLFEQSVEHWQEILRVNLIGPFLAIKHAAPHMIAAEGQGSIICTASVAGLTRQRRRPALQREQGRRDQPGADRGQRAAAAPACASTRSARA